MTKDKIRLAIEKIFNDSKTEFKPVNDLDDDINYFVKIDSSEMAKNVGSIRTLIYFTLIDNSMHIFCPNIYKIKENESSLQILNAINNANGKLTYGNLSFNEKSNTIVYYSKLRMNSINEELNVTIFQEYINQILVAIAILFNELKELNHEGK